jgi:thiol-disulfide isomerase/thioredoxin
MLVTAAVFTAAIGFSSADDAKKAGSVKEQMVALKKSLNDELKDWQKEYTKAAKEDRTKLVEKRGEIIAESAKKALALAKDNLKDEEVMMALGHALQAGNPKIQTEVKDLLTASFIDDPKLVKMLPMLGNLRNGKEFMTTLGEKTKSKDIKGNLAYYALKQDIEEADGKKADAATASFTEISKKLADLVKDYGDCTSATHKTLAEAAKSDQYFIENLTIGKTMPDVEAELLDGKKAKISDYRGKVAVLDIWATWCGPCRAMIPHEREMVEARKDKKFVLISVSADDEKDTLVKFLEKESMPWTHWWDNGGKLTQKYQVRFFPTIYVLDAKGVIRFKHVRGKDMDEAIDTLLKEGATGSQ